MARFSIVNLARRRRFLRAASKKVHKVVPPCSICSLSERVPPGRIRDVGVGCRWPYDRWLVKVRAVADERGLKYVIRSEARRVGKYMVIEDPSSIQVFSSCPWVQAQEV